MDNFEFTKIAGAVLSALLLIFGTKTLIEMNAGHGAAKPGYTLATAAEPTAGAAEPAPKGTDGAAKSDAAPAKAAPAAAGGDAVALLAKAKADNGKAIFGKCKTCHVAEKGKASSVGPNLWGVVNRAKGSLDGFKYSEAMKGKGGNWTFDDLVHFVSNPKGFVPGTKMMFNGLPSAGDQADLVAYLATLADTPVPLPK